MITVRPAEADDSAAWLQLRMALWPDTSETEHRKEMEHFSLGDFPRYPWSALVAVSDDHRVVGFAELSIRPFAEGCQSNHVAYLEGLFVQPESRRQGVGRALVAAAEQWGRSHECTEFASDADPDNTVSFAAHQAFGFADAGLVRCFHKSL